MQSINPMNENASKEGVFVLENEKQDSVSLQDIIYYDYYSKNIKHKLQICFWSDRKDIKTIMKDCYDNIIIIDFRKKYILLLEQPELPEYFRILEKKNAKVCYKVKALPYNHPKIQKYISPNGTVYIDNEETFMARRECEWEKIELFLPIIEDHGVDKIIYDFDTYNHYNNKDKCKKTIDYFKKKIGRENTKIKKIADDKPDNYIQAPSKALKNKNTGKLYIPKPVYIPEQDKNTIFEEEELTDNYPKAQMFEKYLQQKDQFKKL